MVTVMRMDPTPSRAKSAIRARSRSLLLVGVALMAGRHISADPGERAAEGGLFRRAADRAQHR
jgi:hypothetical protein